MTTTPGRRRFARRAVFLGAGLLAAGALAACGSGGSATGAASSGSGSSASAGSGTSHSVMWVSPVASQPGQADIYWAMQQAGATIGWKVSQIDANLSPDKQVQGVDTAIDEQVSAIASWSLDPTTVAGAYLQARNAGIPVVGVNSPGGNTSTNVLWSGSVCTKGGQDAQTAAYLAKLKPGGNLAMISGPPGATPANLLTCLRNAFTAAGLRSSPTPRTPPTRRRARTRSPLTCSPRIPAST